jgi:hypothetical protein
MNFKLHVRRFAEPILIDGSTRIPAVLQALKSPSPTILSFIIDGRTVNVVSTAICGWEQA